jgi:type II secretory pathway pseudopilin PulG
MKLRFSDGRLLAGLAAVVAIAAVAASIWLNPPSVVRARALDQKRLQYLGTTESAIKSYYDVHHALPSDLKALDGDNNPWANNWHDPETQQPFGYEIVNQTSYRLCAVFARHSEKDDSPYDPSPKKHGAGRDCFQNSVTPVATQ